MASNLLHPVCARVIQLLREAREQRGLSKYVVAQRSGLSQQTIGYVEKGQQNPTLETIVRMAEALEVDLDKIIKDARMAVPKNKTK